MAADRPGLKNREKVMRLQEMLIQALEAEISSCHPDEVGLFPRLLMSISSLRELGVEHRRMLESLKGQMSFPHNLYAETFDLIPWHYGNDLEPGDKIKSMATSSCYINTLHHGGASH